jgi:hypothetical protein
MSKRRSCCINVAYVLTVEVSKYTVNTRQVSLLSPLLPITTLKLIPLSLYSFTHLTTLTVAQTTQSRMLGWLKGRAIAQAFSHWTFVFRRMLGSSWVAAQLVASQEGLSSVKFLSSPTIGGVSRRAQLCERTNGYKCLQCALVSVFCYFPPFMCKYYLQYSVFKRLQRAFFQNFEIQNFLPTQISKTLQIYAHDLLGYVRFVDLTVMSMQSSTLWDIIPYSPFKINLNFGETYCFHLQSRRRRQANTRMKHIATRAQFTTRRRKQRVPSNVNWIITSYMAMYPRRLNPLEL